MDSAAAKPVVDVYAFLDNSFLFIEGYKHVRRAAKLPPTKTPLIDYRLFRSFLKKQGNLKRAVICGSELPSSVITNAQRQDFEVFTFPRYPNFKTGSPEEKGIDHKICWEMAKTIWTSRDLPRKGKILLCTGDKDFLSILPDIQTAGWDLEIWLWSGSFSSHIKTRAESFGSVKVLDAEWKEFIRIVEKRKP